MSIYFIDWVSLSRYGTPDEEGMYLCAFTDNTIETLKFYPGEEGTSGSFWNQEMDPHVCHWAEILPEHHPDYDPSPVEQEDVTRIGGWG